MQQVAAQPFGPLHRIADRRDRHRLGAPVRPGSRPPRPPPSPASRPACSPAGTPPATMWSSLPGSSSLSAARRATHTCSPSGATDQAVHVHAHRHARRSWAARRGRAAPAPGRPVRRGCRTPRAASGSSRRRTGAARSPAAPRASASVDAVRRRGGSPGTPPAARRTSGFTQPTCADADAERQPLARQHARCCRREHGAGSHRRVVRHRLAFQTADLHATCRQCDASRPAEAASPSLPRPPRSGMATVRSLLPYLWPERRSRRQGPRRRSRWACCCRPRSPPSTCR